MAPLFSIITVTFNASSTIATTLRSVGEQTCRDFEHIIIDGASTDDTLKLIERVQCSNRKLTSEPDSGIYDAMNKGLDQATGKYVLFLNAGDAFHSPDTLAHIADAIFHNDFPGIVYGQTDIVDAKGRFITHRHLKAPDNLSRESFAEGMVVCHQAFVALTALTSTFDLKYRFSADYDWCIQCLQHSRKNVFMDETLIDYLNEGMSTANRRKSLIERFRIMCYYYGTMPTILRHIKFASRFIAHRRKEKRAIRKLNNSNN